MYPECGCPLLAARFGAGSPNTEPLGQECPLSLAPAGLAVGFGPKELSPTLARRSQLAIHPADLLDPCGSPAPRRHPGARRHGYSVVTVCIRLPTSNVKIVPWTWLRAVFSEVHVICRRRGRRRLASGEANCRKVRLQRISEVQLRVQIAGASEG
jgi:hypothetical protein